MAIRDAQAVIDALAEPQTLYVFGVIAARTSTVGMTASKGTRSTPYVTPFGLMRAASTSTPDHSRMTNYYACAELARHYDANCEGRRDLDFYLAVAARLDARAVVDIGAGTGLLGSLLARRGHKVIAVEPQQTMLDLARQQPGAEQITWIRGTASDLPDSCADLVVMTGHVAQYFLDNLAWRDVLHHAGRALRPSGRIAFEIRNNRAQAWRFWQFTEPRPVHGGTLWQEVLLHGDLVTHVDHWDIDGQTHVTSETLRFPCWADVQDGLAAAGLRPLETWGDWDGKAVTDVSPEWIVVSGAAMGDSG